MEPLLEQTYQKNRDRHDDQDVATSQAASHGSTPVDVAADVSDANNPDPGDLEQNHDKGASSNVRIPSWDNMPLMQMPEIPGFSAQDDYLFQQRDGQTDLIEWGFLERRPSLDENSIDWNQLPSELFESHRTYPGGGGPSGAM